MVNEFEVGAEYLNTLTTSVPTKVDELTTKKQEKLDRLANAKTDLLTGMFDADTQQLQSAGTIRENVPGRMYDAVEIGHGGKPVDFSGKSSAAEAAQP